MGEPDKTATGCVGKGGWEQAPRLGGRAEAPGDHAAGPEQRTPTTGQGRPVRGQRREATGRHAVLRRGTATHHAAQPTET